MPLAKKYRLIGHTADTGLVARGRILAEAFANAASGMFSIMTDLRTVREKESRIVAVKEEGPENLLFEWLNSLLYLFDVEMLLLRRFDIVEFDGKMLQAICHGEKYDPERHKIKLGVKSATYHLLEVDEKKDWVRVIFDI